MAGWICLHRDIQDHWIFKDADRLKAWIDLLLLANHEKKTFQIKGQLVTIDRGQVGLSQVSLCERWGWGHRDRVKRYLTLLENDGMIELKTTHLNSVISICNYSYYQDANNDYKAASKAASKAQTTIEQVNNETSLNITDVIFSENCEKPKKVSKKTEQIAILHEYGVDGDLALDFYQIREDKKARITRIVMDGFIRESEKAGITVENAVRICVERGWRGFKADWVKEKTNGVTQADIDDMSYLNLDTRDAEKYNTPLWTDNYQDRKRK